MESQPNLENVNELLEHKLREHCRHLSKSTVGFIWAAGQEVPETGGSGVLLHIPPGFYFALTAAHVIDELLRSNELGKGVFLCGASEVEQQPIPLGHVRVISSHLHVGEGNVDFFDTAAIRLSDAVADRLLVHSRFLTLSDLDLAVSSEGENCFYVLGYPIQGQPAPDLQNKVITKDPFHFCTHLANKAADQLVVYGDDINLALLLGPEVRHGVMGSPEEIPNLNGISGCGIWRLGPTDKPTEWRPEDAKLVGLEHRVVSSPSVIVGTQVKCVLQFVLETFPELRGAMRTTFRLG